VVNADADLEQDSAALFAMLFSVVLEGEKRLAEHLTTHGLTAPQFYVLKTLVEQGGRMGIGEIARRHGLTNPTMTGLVQRMEALDPPLVRRETDMLDRRAVVVMLTEEGSERFLAVQTSLLGQLRDALALLPTDERRRLLEELQHYMTLLLAAVST